MSDQLRRIRWRLDPGRRRPAMPGLPTGRGGRGARPGARIPLWAAKPATAAIPAARISLRRNSPSPIGSIKYWPPCFQKHTIERLEKGTPSATRSTRSSRIPQCWPAPHPANRSLKAVLRTKHLMNQEVLAMARQLVRRVIQELVEKLATPIRQPFFGASRPPPFLRQSGAQFRLAHHHPAQFEALRLPQRGASDDRDDAFRLARPAADVDRWRIIVLVDQSGSMMGSVIHSAITASIFFGIPILRPHLILFSTRRWWTSPRIALTPWKRLSESAARRRHGHRPGPRIRLHALIDIPRRTILVLVTDFFEGAPIHRLYSATRQSPSRAALRCWVWRRSMRRPIRATIATSAGKMVELGAGRSAP